MGMFSRIFSNTAKPAGCKPASCKPACNLWIGANPGHLTPVDDPKGLGEYKLAVDRLIRDEAPDIIYLWSDTENLSVVRKALQYLSLMGGEVGVAGQLPDEEVGAIFGVAVRTYQGTVIDPQGDAAAFVG
ncbi:hypothetical protein ACQUQQ_00780 [Acidithiobacillus ferrooxidans]|uniref:hypothetical protein n=1 Tax=Acidithiobacillus TaxID=119977 RepID=UPI000B26AD59|nr:hypothetical protein [Acidithiobacillus ferridurans]